MARTDMQGFFSKSYLVSQLADKVATFLFTPLPSANFARYLSLSAGDTASTDFIIRILNVRIDVRLEYVKFVAQQKEFISTQYAFFRQVGEQEERLKTTIRMVGPDTIILPDSDVIELRNDDNDTMIAQQIREVVATSLLEEIMEKMSKWSYD